MHSIIDNSFGVDAEVAKKALASLVKTLEAENFQVGEYGFSAPDGYYIMLFPGEQTEAYFLQLACVIMRTSGASWGLSAQYVSYTKLGHKFKTWSRNCLVFKLNCKAENFHNQATFEKTIPQFAALIQQTFTKKQDAQFLTSSLAVDTKLGKQQS